ncbi:MAG: type IV pilus biogenesis protein PilM [Eubacteriales bacterium]
MKDKLKRVIGLEIFANELRAAEVYGNSSQLNIEAYNSVSLPDGVITDGLIMKPEVFMQYLKNLLLDGNFKAKNMVIEIISRNLILRLASFPKVSPDKQNNVIMLQAQDFIPIPVSELELSYVITSETAVDETTYVNALLVAMKKNIITTLMDTIQNRRLGNYDINDITIGVTTFADEVAMQTNAEVYMLMYFNNVTLDILVIKNSFIVMARSAQLDINITNILNKSTDAPISDDAYNDILEIIKNEFWTSSNFYNIKNKEEINKIYFYASYFTIKQSLRALSTELDTDVEIINIDHKLNTVSNVPLDKYLGCICIAAGKL